MKGFDRNVSFQWPMEQCLKDTVLRQLAKEPEMTAVKYKMCAYDVQFSVLEFTSSISALRMQLGEDLIREQTADFGKSEGYWD